MNEITVPDFPCDDHTLELGAHGMYVSRRVWIDAHRRLTIYFDENGTPTKEDYKVID